MKLVSFLVCVASVALLQTKPLTLEQSAELMAGVIKLQEAFDRGTHTKIYALFGGKETFEKTTAQARQSLKD